MKNKGDEITRHRCDLTWNYRSQKLLTSSQSNWWWITDLKWQPSVLWFSYRRPYRVSVWGTGHLRSAWLIHIPQFFWHQLPEHTWTPVSRHRHAVGTKKKNVPNKSQQPLPNRSKQLTPFHLHPPYPALKTFGTWGSCGDVSAEIRCLGCWLFFQETKWCHSIGRTMYKL